jgi:hypothetical protein
LAWFGRCEDTKVLNPITMKAARIFPTTPAGRGGEDEGYFGQKRLYSLEVRWCFEKRPSTILLLHCKLL